MAPASKSEHQVVRARTDGNDVEVSGYRGSYPPPEIIRTLQELVPDGANHVLTIVEKEQSHVHHVERAEVCIDATCRILGQCFGFVLGVLAICGSVWLMSHGHSLTGFGTLLTGLAILAGVFASGRKPPEPRPHGKPMTQTFDATVQHAGALGVDKLILSAKESIDDELTDYYIVGSGSLTGHTEAETEEDLIADVSRDAKANATLKRLLKEYRSDTTAIRVEVPELRSFVDGNAWPRILAGH